MEGLIGKGVSAMERRGWMAGELRGLKVELSRGSKGAGKFWSGGVTAALCSPAFERGGGGVLRC